MATQPDPQKQTLPASVAQLSENSGDTRSSETSTVTSREQRHLDLASLKALSHPLRVQMYDSLSTYGPNTASGLAEETGESSGSTSYHLRQLARHGFVRECLDRGTGRERWWEVVPGGFEVRASDLAEPAVRQANRAMMTESFRLREQHVRDFMNSVDSYEPQWQGTGMISLSNAHMTPDQLQDFVKRYMELIDEVTAGLGTGNDPQPGSRPVQIQCNAFPVFGGEIEPEGEES